MENTEDSEATPLLREQSGRGRSNQLICLMICAVGCIVTTGMVLLWRNIHGGEGGTLKRRGGVSQGWLYVIFGIFGIYVIYYVYIKFRDFVKRF